MATMALPPTYERYLLSAHALQLTRLFATVRTSLSPVVHSVNRDAGTSSQVPEAYLVLARETLLQVRNAYSHPECQTFKLQHGLAEHTDIWTDTVLSIYIWALRSSWVECNHRAGINSAWRSRLFLLRECLEDILISVLPVQSDDGAHGLIYLDGWRRFIHAAVHQGILHLLSRDLEGHRGHLRETQNHPEPSVRTTEATRVLALSVRVAHATLTVAQALVGSPQHLELSQAVANSHILEYACSLRMVLAERPWPWRPCEVDMCLFGLLERTAALFPWPWLLGLASCSEGRQQLASDPQASQHHPPHTSEPERLACDTLWGCLSHAAVQCYLGWWLTASVVALQPGSPDFGMQPNLLLACRTAWDQHEADPRLPALQAPLRAAAACWAYGCLRRSARGDDSASPYGGVAAKLPYSAQNMYDMLLPAACCCLDAVETAGAALVPYFADSLCSVVCAMAAALARMPSVLVAARLPSFWRLVVLVMSAGLSGPYRARVVRDLAQAAGLVLRLQTPEEASPAAMVAATAAAAATVGGGAGTGVTGASASAWPSGGKGLGASLRAEVLRRAPGLSPRGDSSAEPTQPHLVPQQRHHQTPQRPQQLPPAHPAWSAPQPPPPPQSQQHQQDHPVAAPLALRCAITAGLVPALESALRSAFTTSANDSAAAAHDAPYGTGSASYGGARPSALGPDVVDTLADAWVAVDLWLRRPGVWPGILAHAPEKHVGALILTLRKIAQMAATAAAAATAAEVGDGEQPSLMPATDPRVMWQLQLLALMEQTAPLLLAPQVVADVASPRAAAGGAGGGSYSGEDMAAPLSSYRSRGSKGSAKQAQQAGTPRPAPSEPAYDLTLTLNRKIGRLTRSLVAPGSVPNSAANTPRQGPQDGVGGTAAAAAAAAAAGGGFPFSCFASHEPNWGTLLSSYDGSSAGGGGAPGGGLHVGSVARTQLERLAVLAAAEWLPPMMTRRGAAQQGRLGPAPLPVLGTFAGLRVAWQWQLLLARQCLAVRHREAHTSWMVVLKRLLTLDQVTAAVRAAVTPLPAAAVVSPPPLQLPLSLSQAASSAAATPSGVPAGQDGAAAAAAAATVSVAAVPPAARAAALAARIMPLVLDVLEVLVAAAPGSLSQALMDNLRARRALALAETHMSTTAAIPGSSSSGAGILPPPPAMLPRAAPTPWTLSLDLEATPPTLQGYGSQLRLNGMGTPRWRSAGGGRLIAQLGGPSPAPSPRQRPASPPAPSALPPVWGPGLPMDTAVLSVLMRYGRVGLARCLAELGKVTRREDHQSFQPTGLGAVGGSGAEVTCVLPDPDTVLRNLGFGVCDNLECPTLKGWSEAVLMLACGAGPGVGAGAGTGAGPGCYCCLACCHEAESVAGRRGDLSWSR